MEKAPLKIIWSNQRQSLAKKTVDRTQSHDLALLRNDFRRSPENHTSKKGEVYKILTRNGSGPWIAFQEGFLANIWIDFPYTNLDQALRDLASVYHRDKLLLSFEIKIQDPPRRIKFDPNLRLEIVNEILSRMKVNPNENVKDIIRGDVEIYLINPQEQEIFEIEPELDKYFDEAQLIQNQNSENDVERSLDIFGSFTESLCNFSSYSSNDDHKQTLY